MSVVRCTRLRRGSQACARLRLRAPAQGTAARPAETTNETPRLASGPRKTEHDEATTSDLIEERMDQVNVTALNAQGWVQLFWGGFVTRPSKLSTR